MRHDDRLATVLRLIPGGGHVARVQLRQLIDLLGTAPAEARGDLIDAAYLKLAEVSAAIPVADRAAMLSEPGLRLRSPRLLAALARDNDRVTAAAVHAASLNEEQWLDLLPALPPVACQSLAGRRDLGERLRGALARLGFTGRALPEPEASRRTETIPSDQPAPASATTAPPLDLQPPGEEIGAIRRRIEAFNRNRQPRSAAVRGTAGAMAPAFAAGRVDSPRLPLDEQAGGPAIRLAEGFDFATDADGRIIWADPTVAPMVVGLSLSALAELAPIMRRHQPIRDAVVPLVGARAITGIWRLDASADFDPALGRFTGYVGRFRRPGEPAASPAALARSAEADRLRQVLHELRTPMNAIQGYAEAIQQALFGPAPHEYRALAAAIAADAARILAGFEELDRYARLGSGALSLDRVGPDSEGTDLHALLRQTVDRLSPGLEPRGSGFVLTAEGAEPDQAQEALWVALAPIEAERLCWRLLATLAGSAHLGETLMLHLCRVDAMVELELHLPVALAGMDDTSLFHAVAETTPSGLSAGMFGAGFALRLAAVEARAAGGSLVREGARLRLSLPIAERACAADLTGAPENHSHCASAATVARTV